LATVAVMPVGPPQNGIVGLTLPASAGCTRTSAKSLKSHAAAFVSPVCCIAIHEL
jgi:hypothetical protein